MTAKKTWIVVADGARARIACGSASSAVLQPALSYDLAVSRLPSRALGSDRPGRYAEAGPARRHAVEPRSDPHQQQKLRFARDVAALLERAAVRGDYDWLVLVAPPPALGRLRAALGRRARAALKAEIGRDLTRAPVHAWAKRLLPAIWPLLAAETAPAKG